MKLKSHVTVRATPMQVWPYVADPLVMATWNPKIVSCDRDAKDTVRVGERFEMIYRMSGEKRETTVEVVRSEPAAGVTYRHHFNAHGEDRLVDERYDLSHDGDATRVDQVVDMSQARLPLALRAVMLVILKFGTSTEKEYLDQLRDTVEKDLGLPPAGTR